MKKQMFVLCLLFFVYGCKIQSGSDQVYPNAKGPVYKLQLRPVKGSQYQYDITNETTFKIEADDNPINNQNKSTVRMVYVVFKDSTGNFIFRTSYNKIQLYTKNGDEESNLDADNASVSVNPVERMLGILKNATIEAVVSPAGDQKEIRGFKEVGEKIMQGFAEGDTQAKEIAQKEWETVVMNGLVKNNLTQLFQLFPDSAIRAGDKWKVNTIQEGEVKLKVKTTYRLTNIAHDVAFIEANSDLESDDTPGSGLAPTSNLKGKQEAAYEMQLGTGMLIQSHSSAKIKGSIQSLGREFPVTIETSAAVKGEQLK